MVGTDEVQQGVLIKIQIHRQSRLHEPVEITHLGKIPAVDEILQTIMSQLLGLKVRAVGT